MDDLETFMQLEKGDRILFNDRKVPLKVSEVNERVHVKGPQGGEYILFRAENQEKLLVATKGRREYASYLENLREVGRWVREGDSWRHSKTGETVRLERNEIGRWTVNTSLDADFAAPKYGYSNREAALEDAEKLVDQHPEGKANR
ncbi:MAG: hypothetical protein ABEJ98_01240 [Candidatus Nanohaloarchaea archaeon]